MISEFVFITVDVGSQAEPMELCGVFCKHHQLLDFISHQWKAGFTVFDDR